MQLQLPASLRPSQRKAGAVLAHQSCIEVRELSLEYTVHRRHSAFAAPDSGTSVPALCGAGCVHGLGARAAD